jgi:glutamate synthase domain-containing protein 1
MNQLLIKSGRSPAEALMILVPEAYKKHPTLSIKYPEVWFWACMRPLLYEPMQTTMTK